MCEELEGFFLMMLPHDSGEAGEQSETEGGAMQSIALSLSYITQSYRFAPPLSQQADSSPKPLGEHREKRKCDGFYINTEVKI